MGSTQYLIDTNVVIDYLRRKLPDSGMSFVRSVVNEIPNLSVITKIELLGFDESSEGYKVLNGFIGDSTIIGLSDSIVDTTITIRRKNKIKLPDAIIAATALVHDLSLLTRNSADFDKIKGLKLVNPWEA